MGTEHFKPIGIDTEYSTAPAVTEVFLCCFLCFFFFLKTVPVVHFLHLIRADVPLHLMHPTGIFGICMLGSKIS